MYIGTQNASAYPWAKATCPQHKNVGMIVFGLKEGLVLRYGIQSSLLQLLWVKELKLMFLQQKFIVFCMLFPISLLLAVPFSTACDICINPLSIKQCLVAEVFIRLGSAFSELHILRLRTKTDCYRLKSGSLTCFNLLSCLFTIH